MNIVIVNGSPRKGNTAAAINALVQGCGNKHDIEIIEADKLSISGCKGCNACQCTNGCVAKDDTNPVIDKITAADFIVFASPVYWWGITAQLKLVIDKCYCRGSKLRGKKIGLITIGGADTSSIQYELITKQFECIKEYLGWDIVFNKSFSANGKDELAGNSAVIEELRLEGSKL